MQIIKTHKEMQEVEVIDEKYNVCDKCDEKIEVDMYDAFSCDFTVTTGHRISNDGSGEYQEMELCKICTDKLVEFLKENGYRIRTREWDC